MSKIGEYIGQIMRGCGAECIDVDARMAAVLDTVLMLLDDKREVEKKITDVIQLWRYISDADAPTVARMELHRLKEAIDVLDEAIRCRHGL